MATRKAVNTVPKDRVEVFLPKTPGRDEPDVFVGINGVSYLIPRGKKVFVPKEVAEELNRSQEAATMLDEHIDELLSRPNNVNTLG